ncbi:MAG TPA: SxtJ family membrane protein [Acidobacteriota bacterium]|nr:SxtJ family membrane protein [Acidobacteriota bacterium]
MIQINRQPSPRELRQFGLIWTVFFSGAAALYGYRSGDWETALWLGGAAVVMAAAGFLVLGWMRMLYLGLSYAAFPIGWVISHALLAIIYYLVVTPIGLLMRLLGRDPMQRRFEEDQTSYWSEQEPSLPSERYFRQF